MTRSRLLLCLPVMWLWACGSGAPSSPTQSPPVIIEEPPPTNPPVEPPPVDPPPVDPPPVTPEAQRPFTMPALQASVPEYELIIPEAAMKKFEADVWTPEQDAVFKAGGTTYQVKVRLRGASARYFPKKSWNVSFEKDARFEGRTSLNLVAEFADATMLAEKMAFDLMAAMRVPASKATYVRLKLNGQYQGVFLDIEQVNKAFLKAHAFADDDATIYRCGWKDCELKTWKVPYQGDWTKKTNEQQPDDALLAMLDVINHTPEPQFAEALEKHLQLEHYLRSMVLDALMSNNFVEDSESYFIYDRAVAKWSYVPWDLNNVDARWWYLNPVEGMSTSSNNMRHPLFNFTLTDAWTERMYLQRKTETQSYPGYLPVFSNLGTRVLANPALREQLGARLDKALDELFTPEVMNPYIDALHALITPHMRGAPYTDFAQFQAGRDYMKRYVKERRTFVEKDWARLKAQGSPLVFEAFDPVAGWVDVGNRGTVALSLKGMVLTTNLRVSLAQSDHAPTLVRTPVGAVLPDVTVAPGAKVRLKLSELGIQLMPKGELGLFDGKSVVGVKDFLFYGALRAGQQYERGDKGWEVR
ncbi:CotH kinase family protein [Myxococcus sp. CA039A]|uniref:CotH kinase family protein n=1 Tax=Myxococcus sp. CA039A TaxID=2741737 RepID=UPI00157A27D4|nr:CotH kinase family protein [Myxococcus sp. CA039A]NTX53618.1 CotH kinase family protein [Myxococcus sp. CA039A]